MNSISKCLFLLIATLIFTSCITSPYSESVIEKSKQVRPSWVEQTPKIINTKTDRLSFNFLKESENELALTIRESQPNSKKEFLNVIDSKLRALFLKTLKEHKTEYDLNSSYFSKPYQNFLDKVLHKHINIEDLYFEKVLIENTEVEVSVTTTYRVWIYLSINNQILKEDITQLANYFLARKTPQLRHIGAALSKVKVTELFKS